MRELKSPERREWASSHSRIRKALTILPEHCFRSIEEQDSLTTYDAARVLASRGVGALDVYRAAAHLRENEIKEVVQFLTFEGSSAPLVVLRLLNIMRGLPGNWELAADWLHERTPEQFAEFDGRAMTLLAFLGGTKSYRLCSWAKVIERAMAGEEEAKIALCTILDKKWDGGIETTYSVSTWKSELEHASEPSIWREMRWAAHCREVILTDGCVEMAAARSRISSAVKKADTDSSQVLECIEQLPADLGTVSEMYVRVCGTLLKRRKSPPGIRAGQQATKGESNHTLYSGSRFGIVITPQVKNILGQMARAISFGKAIVLEGSSGCGKTSVISLLARETWHGPLEHNQEVPGVTFVQMDSAMSDADGDSFLSMVGSVVPLPDGAGFQWRAGPIGLAIERGEWLVCENFGKSSSAASSSVPLLTQLASLEAGDELKTPGRAQALRVGSGFRCIITRSVADLEKSEIWEPPGGWSKWQRVCMPSTSVDEKILLLRERYSHISDCIPRVVKAAEEVSEYVRKQNGPLMREPTLRETVRICERLEQLRLNDASLLTVENALLDTLDVLLAWCTRQKQKLVLLSILANCWSLNTSIGEQLCNSHRPSYSADNMRVRIGRASVARSRGATSLMMNTLSQTGHTLRYLERCLRCLEVGEHVLLTGEAGCGKTSVIQELARLLGKKLVVINLSKQSEMSDLVGSFRPVELESAIPALAKRFETAFCHILSKARNGRFIDALRTAARFSESHPRAVRLMRGAMEAIPQRPKVDTAIDLEEWDAIKDKLEQLTVLLFPSPQVSTAKNAESLDDKVSNKEPPEPARKRPRVGAGKSGTDGRLEMTAHVPKKPSGRRVDFRFTEGILAQAMRNGSWVLLDEINLAPAELLERLVSVADRGQLVLPNEDGTVLSQSQGFKLFGAMNPPTDVGKRPLPGVMRSRFTEFYVEDMLNTDDIVTLTLDRMSSYYTGQGGNSREEHEEKLLARDVAQFYIGCHQFAKEGRLENSCGKPVRFSLRSLSRMLDVATRLRRIVKTGPANVRRAVYEGVILAFCTQLQSHSREIVTTFARTVICQLPDSVSHLPDLSNLFLSSVQCSEMIRFVASFPLLVVKSVGDQGKHNLDGNWFVISETVKQTLKDVCRAMVYNCPRYPILLQGPTAAGKTSLVKYLAEVTGNQLIRINNHEHTELSEYLGSYVISAKGSLMFQEGPLVKAAREGSWILLDELNLAPPDILEALNRLLDDNRELMIPETGEVIKAVDGFAVFATQNPPGLYGGRKELSRAFRSRFVEIEVGELLDQDLSTILESGCLIPKSFAVKMIEVMRKLQLRRSTSSLFAGRHGFITARDLFRWAGRGPRSKEELAIYGYLLLGERSRKAEEKEVVRDILVNTIGIDPCVLDPHNLYSVDMRSSISAIQDCVEASLLKLKISREQLLIALDEEEIVRTPHTMRLVILLVHTMANQEPALLVGATGGGKTSCCSAVCRALKRQMLTVNCHRHTEASDLVGSFRPVRVRELGGSPFEWVDGPVVDAMKRGCTLLVDEINMAHDAVVERLNSVLEPERSLLLSEKGLVSRADTIPSSERVEATEGFHILATMNPGGDFGKKELSAALRNRFTEIWIPEPSSVADYAPIVCRRLQWGARESEASSRQVATAIIEFLGWSIMVNQDANDAVALKHNGAYLAVGMTKFLFSIRDVVAWCDFVSAACSTRGLEPMLAFIHGARLVFLEGLAVGATSRGDVSTESFMWKKLLEFVPESLLEGAMRSRYTSIAEPSRSIERSSASNTYGALQFDLFSIPTSHESSSFEEFRIASSFSFEASFTTRNCARIARAMILRNRPILLEGPPGCGKSSLVTALAQLTGFKFVRINLSESTEMADLVGTECPGSAPGTFSFREGPLLTALRAGSWVLLDELNLASQSVLEGLNSVLDHRRSIFVPETGEKVSAFHSFRVFGAQNPASDGGGRRGLPYSFLNRFTRVYIEDPGENDILDLITALYPEILRGTAESITAVLKKIGDDFQDKTRELDRPTFKLRDTLRWCDLLHNANIHSNSASVARRALNTEDRSRIGLFFDVAVLQSLGAGRRRRIAEIAFEEVFGFPWNEADSAPSIAASEHGGIRIGSANVLRSEKFFCMKDLEPCSAVLSCTRTREMQAMAFGVNLAWPVAVRSELEHSAGKDCSDFIKVLAGLYGRSINFIDARSLSDCDDFVGSYSQQSILHLMEQIVGVVDCSVKRCMYLQITNQRPNLSLESDGTVGLFSLQEHISSVVERFRHVSVSESDEVDKFLKQSNDLKVLLSLGAVCDPQLLSNVQIIGSLREKLLRVCKSLKHREFVSFDWQKSNILQSIESGEWVVFENADDCSPAILDRLNPLLEKTRQRSGDRKPAENVETPSILLAEAPPNEDGTPVVLKPHPSFRIFFITGSSCVKRSKSAMSKALQDRALKVVLCSEPLDKESDSNSLENSKTVMCQPYSSWHCTVMQSDCGQNVHHEFRGLAFHEQSDLKQVRYAIATQNCATSGNSIPDSILNKYVTGKQVRTHAVDFALRPLAQLLDRDLAILRNLVSMSLEDAAKLICIEPPIFDSKKLVLTIAGFCGLDALRWVLSRGSSEVFLFGCRSGRDVQRRVDALIHYSRYCENGVVAAAYQHLHSRIRPEVLSKLSQISSSFDDGGDGIMLPVDPLFGGERSFLRSMGDLESSHNAPRFAKRLRFELLGLGAFVTTWEHAIETSRESTRGDSNIFYRARMHVEVGNESSFLAGDNCQGAVSYHLLHRMHSIASDYENGEVSADDWETAKESEVMCLFRAGADLCQIMVQNSTFKTGEEEAFLLEIYERCSDLYRKTGNSHFDIRGFLSFGLTLFFKQWIENRDQDEVLLLPRRAEGQRIELDMISLLSGEEHVPLKFPERSGLIKGIATLATGKFEENQNVLGIFEKVSACIAKSRLTGAVGNNWLQSFKDGEQVKLLNRVELIVFTLCDDLVTLSQDQKALRVLLKRLSKAMCSLTCLDNIRLETKVSFQRLFWIVEALFHGKLLDLQRCNFRDLTMRALSTYLHENASFHLKYTLASSPSLVDNLCTRDDVSTSDNRKSPEESLWNISSKKRQLVSAMLSHGLGSYLSSKNRQCSKHLLTTSLQTAMQCVRSSSQNQDTFGTIASSLTEPETGILASQGKFIGSQSGPMESRIQTLQSDAAAKVSEYLDATLSKSRVQSDDYMTREVQDYSRLGSTWIAVGLFQLYSAVALVCDVHSCDPSDLAKMVSYRKFEDGTKASADLFAYRTFLSNRMGGDCGKNTIPVQRLTSEKRVASTAMRKAAARYVSRPKNRQTFASFVTFGQNINSAVIEKVIRSNLASRLCNFTASDDSQSNIVEEAVDLYRACESRANSLEMTGTLSHFRDISVGLHFGMRQLQQGLAYSLRAQIIFKLSRGENFQKRIGFRDEMYRFPRGAYPCARDVQDVLVCARDLGVSFNALLSCAEYLMNVETNDMSPNLKSVSSGITVLSEYWKKARLAKDEKLQRESSLYVLRRTGEGAEILNREIVEQLEADFDQDYEYLFNPVDEEWEESMLGLGFRRTGEKAAVGQVNTNAETASEDMDSERFWAIHERAFTRREERMRISQSMHSSILMKFSQTLPTLVSLEHSGLDVHPNVWDFLASLTAVRKFESVDLRTATRGSHDQSYNFYIDANITESIRVSEALCNLLAKVSQLQKSIFADSGDHPVLAEVAETVTRVAHACSVSTPLAHVTVGIENILRKLNEWQRLFARPETRLNLEIKELSRILVDWRKIEMMSWTHLLSRRILSFHARASGWFFYLYDAIIGEATSEEFLNPSAQRSVVSTVDQFLRSSPTGEFETRVRMVLSISAHLLYICKTETKSLAPLGRALRGIAQYYSLFLPTVLKETAVSQNIVFAKLEEFCKLVVWDAKERDVASVTSPKEHERHLEYFRMKATADRNKRKLHKLCLEMDALWHVPVHTYLTRQLNRTGLSSLAEEALEEAASLKESIPKGSLRSRIEVSVANLIFGLENARTSLHRNKHTEPPEHAGSRDISSLQEKIQRFGKVVDTARTSLCDIAVDFTSRLRSDVRTRSLRLRQSEARGVQLKKRALVELFRALQGAGLSPYAQVPRATFSDPYYWLSCPEPTQDESYNTLASELYFTGAQQMRRLRDVSDMRSRNPDITSSEATKSEAFCADLFTRARSQRFAMNALFGELRSVMDLSTIMKGLEHQTKSVASRTAYDSHALLRIAGIFRNLERACRDLDVVVACLHFGVKTSLNLPNFPGIDVVDQLLSDDAPAMKESLQSVETLLQVVTGTVRKYLCTPEVQRLLRTSDSLIIMDSVNDDICKSAVEHLKIVQDVLASQLVNTQKISGSNIGVQLIMPIVKSLEEELGTVLVTESNSLAAENGQIEDVCSSMITQLKKLTDLVLVGAQNVLIWNRLSPEDVLERKPHTSENLLPEQLPRVRELKVAHEEILAFRAKSKVAELNTSLHENFKLLRRFMSMKSRSGPWAGRFREICLQQRQFGTFVQTFVLDMISPSLRKISLLHCHSLALLRSLSSLFAGLCEEGYCRPNDESVTDVEPESSVVEEQRGAGFGEAGDGDLSAAQDVSAEIEDEEQLLGLRNNAENNEEPENPHDQSETGFDMVNDFEGNLQDAEPLGDQNEAEDDEMPKELSGEGGTGDNAVNQKLWGNDEAEPGDNPENSELQSAPNESLHGNLVGKEGSDPNESSKSEPDGDPIADVNKDPSNDPTPTHETAEVKADEPPRDEDGKDSGNIEGDESKVGNDGMDLPDDDNCDATDRVMTQPEISDLNAEDYGGENQNVENSAGSDVSPDRSGIDVGDVEERGSCAMDIDSDADDTAMDGVPQDVINNAEVEKERLGSSEDEGIGGELHLSEETEKNRNGEAEEGDPENIPADCDTGKCGASQADGLPDTITPNTEDKLSSEQLPLQGEPESRGLEPQEYGQKGPGHFAPYIDASERGSATNPKSEGSQIVSDPDAKGFQSAEVLHQGVLGGAAGPGTEEGYGDAGLDGSGNVAGRPVGHDASVDHGSAQKFEPNPLRVETTDELLSDWSRYLRQVGDESKGYEAGDTEQNGSGNASSWRFLNEETAEEVEDVALAAATTDQHRPLPAVDELVEEQDDIQLNDADRSRDRDQRDSMPQTSSARTQDVERMNPRDFNDSKEHNKQIDEAGKRLNDDAKQALQRDRLDNPDESMTDSPMEATEHVVQTANVGDGGEEIVTPAEFDLRPDNSNEVPVNTKQLTLGQATKLWQQLQHASASDASILCERLRLILEPTVASGLAGGYKTGKRLNMRKVIEFVASDFRKDRIWLRRVQPDRRSYDVLLAVDDSESMSESKAGSLAMASLSLISSALSKLEVGRLGIASFGAEPRMIYDFDEPLPLSDERGGEIVQMFEFAQKETNVAKLLRFMLATMGDMGSAVGGEPMKLAFVVSDGRLSSREEIRQYVRQLKEANVLVAFIIIDRVDEAEASIYDVKRVEYDERGRISVMPFMTEFPFEFHAVLDDVTQLPAILADALHQWIELSSSNR